MSMEDEGVPVGDDGAALPGNGEPPSGGERGPRDDIVAAGPRPLDDAAGGDAADGHAADGDAADGRRGG